MYKVRKLAYKIANKRLNLVPRGKKHAHTQFNFPIKNVKR
jgi:hypothetical protein